MKKFILSLSFILCSATLLLAQHTMHHASVADARKPFRQQIGQRVIYHLYVTDTMIRYDSGKLHMAMAINGQIPAPALYFTEGDTAEIYVHNRTNMETGIHWHGLTLPNEQDGVPYLTTAPIKEGETHLYQFPLVQNGTYWYHSHAMLQQQSGLYGAFVIHKKDEIPSKEYTLLLSDWTNDKPEQVNRFLHNASDWYAIRKKSVQSYGKALTTGHLKTKLVNEWKRMRAMDVSDVYYDAFTSNGKIINTDTSLHAGDKVRLHVVNGSSSTYFWLTWAGGKMTVMANDGKDVAPVSVDKMIIATAETYDIELTISDNMSYELRATAEDRTKYTSTFFGKGMKMTAPELGRLDYFAGMKMMNGMMNMDGSMDDMGMDMSLQQMDMNKVMYPELKKGNSNMAGMNMTNGEMQMDTKDKNANVTLHYAMLRSQEKTTLPDGIWRTFNFNLTGNMNRYLWTINNRTVSESDKILIKKGENIRIVLYNGTMMRHPMHLHGHFFRVLNGHGDYSPLKNTLDIMPMETDTLEFAADQSGDWFFHCHILYHMMSGMGRIFSYENSPYNPQVPDPAKGYKMVQKDDRQLYPMASIGLESNGTDGFVQLSNIRYQLNTSWRIGLNSHNGYETESHFGRYVGAMQWLMPYVGWDYRFRRDSKGEKNLFGQVNTKDDRKAFCFGVNYTLPMLIIADTRIDTDGKLRIQLSRQDVALTERLRLSAMWNTDKEWMTGLRYVMGKYWSLSSHYDSDMGWGGGITLNY